MNNKPYTYVEADSSLYGPDGSFLKQLYCPKAVSWNQLLADDRKDRSRGCAYCSKRVINLDVVDPSVVVQALKKDTKQCVFGTEKSIRFLADPKRPKHPTAIDGTTPVTIYTVRNAENINRGVTAGFWPDVRLVSYNTKQLQSKFVISQNSETGEIDVGYDLREGARESDDWHEIIKFTYYYPYYQETPLAAYLVPKGLPAGTPVVVPDPIEDILGDDFGQGDSAKARNIRGVWDGERIVLNISEVKVRYSLG